MKKRPPSGRDANTDTPHMVAAREKLYALRGRARPWWLGTAPETNTRIREHEEQRQKALADLKTD